DPWRLAAPGGDLPARRPAAHVPRDPGDEEAVSGLQGAGRGTSDRLPRRGARLLRDRAEEHQADRRDDRRDVSTVRRPGQRQRRAGPRALRPEKVRQQPRSVAMRMKRMSLLLVAALAPTATAQGPAKSGLERDPRGWIDLLPGKDLKGWKRVPIAPDTKLSDRNPWKVEGDLLLCDGVGIKEMLLYEKEFGDGVFHIEWRFRK